MRENCQFVKRKKAKTKLKKKKEKKRKKSIQSSSGVCDYYYKTYLFYDNVCSYRCLSFRLIFPLVLPASTSLFPQTTLQCL